MIPLHGLSCGLRWAGGGGLQNAAGTVSSTLRSIRDVAAGTQRMSNPHLAAASCALGMLVYAGVTSLVPDAGAAWRRAAGETAPVMLRSAADEQAAACRPLMVHVDPGAATASLSQASRAIDVPGRMPGVNREAGLAGCQAHPEGRSRTPPRRLNRAGRMPSD